jgi:hypothetical protein
MRREGRRYLWAALDTGSDDVEPLAFAFFSSRFSLMVLPCFFAMLWRGDLSDMGLLTGTELVHL